MSEEKYKDIIKKMESLPQGGITYKKINGKEYAYYQWREDGKQRSRRAKDEELELLTAQIERRKELENVLKEAGLMPKTKSVKSRKTAEKKPAEKKTKTTKSTKTTKTKANAKPAPVADAKIASRWLDDEDRKAVRTALYQPGESDEQGEDLIRFLLEDEFFCHLSQSERETMASVLRARMQARMLEDRLHFETKAAKRDCEVFHLCLEEGAFEMVVADPKAGTCQLYEIKHCNDLAHAHTEHLLDDVVCDAVAGRYGKIDGKFVLYHGKTINVMEAGSRGTMESVRYWNVEKYIESLKK